MTPEMTPSGHARQAADVRMALLLAPTRAERRDESRFSRSQRGVLPGPHTFLEPPPGTHVFVIPTVTERRL